MSKRDDRFDENYPWHRYRVNNGRIMLTAVVSLFIVVLIVVAIYVYSRCRLRRRATHGGNAHLATVSVTNAQTHTQGPPKMGLNPSVIAALPMFVYRKSERPVNDHGIECAVCLSALEDEEMARILPNCKHTFHAQCIDMWLRSHSTCPICRTGAEPKGPVEKVELDGATAPPLGSSQVLPVSSEGGAKEALQSPKAGASGSRLGSLRRMLSRERSSSRMQCSGQPNAVEDLERQ